METGKPESLLKGIGMVKETFLEFRQPMGIMTSKMLILNNSVVPIYGRYCFHLFSVLIFL